MELALVGLQEVFTRFLLAMSADSQGIAVSKPVTGRFSQSEERTGIVAEQGDSAVQPRAETPDGISCAPTDRDASSSSMQEWSTPPACLCEVLCRWCKR